MDDGLFVPERGDLYRITFRGAGHELRGPHYAVVVSEYPYTRLSTVAVVPFSSQAPPASFHPETLIEGKRTRALIEQLTSIGRTRLRDQIGSLAGTPVMDEIDARLRSLFGFDE